MQLRPIGSVRAAFANRKELPRLGGPAAVELFPEFARGLHRLEKHTHLWVMVWLHEADRGVLEVTPRGVSDTGPEGLHGVFAVRSPVRPNPIGLTLAKILGVDGLRIDCDRLDFVDGTPVVDLKPYFVSRDAVMAARNQQIGQPADQQALRESLTMQAVNFHGEVSEDIELAVDIYTQFRAGVLQMVEPINLRVTVPLDRPVLGDAFIGMARVSPGRGTLRFARQAKVRLECDGAEMEYVL